MSWALSVIITSLIDSYGSENQLKYLGDASDSLEEFLAKDYQSSLRYYFVVHQIDEVSDGLIPGNGGYADNSYLSFSDYLTQSESRIIPVITLLSDSISDLFVFITNGSGEVYISGGAESLLLETELVFQPDGKYVVDESFMKQLINEGSISGSSDLNGLLCKRNIISALPISDPRGNFYGGVFVCTTDAGVNSLLDAMQKTVIMSCLWIMLASLIVTYFISERLVAPIKDMSQAAHSFAEGKFDVRVNVVGNDEISELAIAFNEMASSMQELEDMRRSFSCECFTRSQNADDYYFRFYRQYTRWGNST